MSYKLVAYSSLFIAHRFTTHNSSFTPAILSRVLLVRWHMVYAGGKWLQAAHPTSVAILPAHSGGDLLGHDT